MILQGLQIYYSTKDPLKCETLQGKPDTTMSTPPVASEKTNRENTQKNENHSADNAEVNVSPAHEENDELQEEELADC